jgi:hypothetical protein
VTWSGVDRNPEPRRQPCPVNVQDVQGGVAICWMDNEHAESFLIPNVVLTTETASDAGIVFLVSEAIEQSKTAFGFGRGGIGSRRYVPCGTSFARRSFWLNCSLSKPTVQLAPCHRTDCPIHCADSAQCLNQLRVAPQKSKAYGSTVPRYLECVAGPLDAMEWPPRIGRGCSLVVGSAVDQTLFLGSSAGPVSYQARSSSPPGSIPTNQYGASQRP